MLTDTEKEIVNEIQRRENFIREGKEFNPKHDRAIINNLLVLIRNLFRGPDEKQEMMMDFPEDD